MKAEELEKFLKKESDRVWRKRGGRFDDLPEPQLTLTRKERVEQIRKKYEMREKDRQRKIRARKQKKQELSLWET